MSRLQVRGVDASYGPVPVLRGVDLDVPSGQLLAVLGPSGCGKTTLLRAVAGLHRVDAGEVVVGDVVLSGPGVHVPAERRRVGLVPQEGALFPHLDVAANVGFGLRRRDRRTGSRVAELLELVGLAGLGARPPSALSGGQQQRVALARALAPDPGVVLLDEPFSALDAGLRATVRTEVRALLREQGVTAVLVTHDQDEALSTADLVAVVLGGCLAQVGRPQQVYRRPVSVEVGLFVGRAAVLAGTVSAGVVRTALGGAAATGVPDGPAQVLLRPEQVRVHRDDGPGRVRATVCGSRFHGPVTELDVRLGDGTVVTTAGSEPDGPAPGSEAWAEVVGAVCCYPA